VCKKPTWILHVPVPSHGVKLQNWFQKVRQNYKHKNFTEYEMILYKIQNLGNKEKTIKLTNKITNKNSLRGLSQVFYLQMWVQESHDPSGDQKKKSKLGGVDSLIGLHNSCYCSCQGLDTQTRWKGQFCIVLTLSPCLQAFWNKRIFDNRLNSKNSYLLRTLTRFKIHTEVNC